MNFLRLRNPLKFSGWLSLPLGLSLGLVTTNAFAQATPLTAPLGESVPEEAPRPPPPNVEGHVEITKTVNFRQAVKEAIERDTDARRAIEDVRRVHALMEEARSQSLPMLNAQGTYTRLDNDRVSNGVVTAAKGTLFLDLGLSVPLVNARGWTQWQQASDQIDVAKLTALDVRRLVAVAAARAYLTVVAQKNILITSTVARDNAKAHYEFTHAQRVGGVGNRLDEMRAAQELATDEGNLQNAQVSLVRAREALGVLITGNGAIDAQDGPDNASDDQQRLPSAKEAVKGAENDRSDVRARKRAVEAAERRVHQAWADYFPTLSLFAEPFYSDPASPTYPQTGWEAQLILTVPLYDGGLRYGQEHERESLAEEARIDLEATQRQARSDARTASEELNRADAALDQARQAATFGKKTLELASIAYKAGATSNLEVIDAERAARDTQAAADIAEDAARQARLDLLAASGRFP
jgi:outer membrane protein TolC